MKKYIDFGLWMSSLPGISREKTVTLVKYNLGISSKVASILAIQRYSALSLSLLTISVSRLQRRDA
jgi:DNA segregation ATPase FtsK/SpoIIIE-like protein